MREQNIIKRYADAFLGYCSSTIGEKRAVEELLHLRNLLRHNPEFRKFLEYRGIGQGVKAEVLEKALSAGFSDEIKHFLKLLLRKRRIEYLTDIVHYVQKASAHGEALPAVVSFAYPLDLEALKEIRDRLEKKFNRRLKLYLDFDPGLLAGVRVRVGNTILDGTLRRRLDDLRGSLRAVRMAYGD